jgi:hypothetical protein
MLRTIALIVAVAVPRLLTWMTVPVVVISTMVVTAAAAPVLPHGGSIINDDFHEICGVHKSS